MTNSHKRLHRVTVACALSLLTAMQSFGSPVPTEFSQDSAYETVKFLAGEIGPRTMGSPGELRALAYAVSKFSEYGCQRSYIMPIANADGINTTSGVAIGVLNGRSGRVIVIGGHVDSQGPEVPGANDDGSGAACVIELARVLAQRQNESTIMFCCWGGEEQGLEGSKYFVKNFEGIDSVALMLQIDMADGAGALTMDPDAPLIKAPRWLPQAAFEIFYDQLHGSGLQYLTASETINSALGGASGSDHASFIEKGIPAIDFTSDVNFPIHTPQDNLENFTPSGLKRSGDLIIKLVERFDAGVPSRSTEEYMLFQLGHRLVVVEPWMLWSFIAISIALAVVAWVIVRDRRFDTQPGRRVKWSGMKLLLFTVIIQTFIWSSENIIGLIRGYRFPWANNTDGFLVLGILFGLIGVWVVLQIARSLRLAPDAYPFARLGFILFLLEVMLCGLRGPWLAVYPAAAMLMFALSLLTRRPFLKFTFLACSVAAMVRLIFFEEFRLYERLITQTMFQFFSQTLLHNGAFIVFFVIISLPFACAFAAVYRDSGVDLLWLRKLRTRPGLIVVACAAAGMSIVLLTRPVYDRQWAKNIRVEQQYTVGADSSIITIKGSEYLSGLSVRDGVKDTVLNEHTTFHKVQPSGRSGVSWCAVNAIVFAVDSSKKDSLRTVERRINIHTGIRPLRIGLTYTSPTAFQVQSPYAHGGDTQRLGRETDSRKTFSWYSFPDTDLVVPITFTLKADQKVTEHLEVVYDSLAYPLTVRSALSNTSMRTIVTATDTVSARSRI